MTPAHENVSECVGCIAREAQERNRRTTAVRRFENGGMMLRWTMDNCSGWAFTSAWLRLMGMTLGTDRETVEASRWKT